MCTFLLQIYDEYNIGPEGTDGLFHHLIECPKCVFLNMLNLNKYFRAIFSVIRRNSSDAELHRNFTTTVLFKIFFIY
jgi:hypothetical protein